ncbi:hypothetical protein FFT09_16925 [Saccharomonospora piscinae]|uniref:hypothetical protein n=1 Tax=Saccharomonospora piscinae TaxID=687388 RepID=UPI001106E159|nr:hypothetical protein [Saccharomonospora piscinae]TLW90962.1 hypothetical protein FFT09_16925 [Saccharomonospora piscinae]
MRVVRFPARPTRVSDDVRAALTSLGRGDAVAGGIALLGVTPPETGVDVDAVLILPTGVLVVVGVDLPDPALTLSAPLDGVWVADGWPLVQPDETADAGGPRGSPNPATAALAAAGQVADRIHGIDPAIGVGVVIAVGPYVERVEQPASDAAGSVRVVYPSATSMLAATEALPVPARTMTTGQARAVFRGLAPAAAEFDEAALTAEGFSTDTAGTTPVAPPPAGAVPSPRLQTRVISALAALLVVTAVLATILAVSSGDTPTPAARLSENSAAPTVPTDGMTKDGMEFTLVARDHSRTCTAEHAVGDLRPYVTERGCTDLRRGSFTATLDGRSVAVSVGEVTFGDASAAEEFLALADTPGTGVLTDAATQHGKWPAPAPTFAGAAYASARDGATVRLVLAGGPGAAAPTDATYQRRAAFAALTLPLD